MMFNSVDDVLDFAIKGEAESNAFYTKLAGKVETPHMKKVFEEFALEEAGHKAKLEAIREGKSVMLGTAKVTDLKIGDYLVDIEPKAEMTYQEALILAMKKEKAAFRLYSAIALTAEKEELRTLFHGLAQEEAKHKLRFEVEYDDNVLEWN